MEENDVEDQYVKNIDSSIKRWSNKKMTSNTKLKGVYGNTHEESDVFSTTNFEAMRLMSNKDGN